MIEEPNPSKDGILSSETAPKVSGAGDMWLGTIASLGQATGPIPPRALKELGPARSLAPAQPSAMACAAASQKRSNVPEPALPDLQQDARSRSLSVKDEDGNGDRGIELIWRDARIWPECHRQGPTSFTS